jgi:two-component system KDP operon response regulator KdpE
MSPEHFAVLIAAGDPEFRRMMRETLSATGFQLAEASGIQAALDMANRQRFDLVLMDLHVPDQGAAAACRLLRAEWPLLGIIVACADPAENDAEEFAWRMFEAGADDCVLAPFRYRELVARLGAVLRRPLPTKTRPRDLLRAGNLELDLKQRKARQNGKQIHLSPREFDLLAVLMSNAGVALTHTRLARSAWGDTTPHNREYLRTYIQSLRQKLENDPAHPQYILTQPWVGYRFSSSLQNKTN